MLMAHPAVLARLLEEYDRLQALHGGASGDPEVRRRMDDLEYTLCVSTGTRDVRSALVAARGRLPGARAADDTLVAG